MEGTEKQIKYANDIINEVERLMPIARDILDESMKNSIERYGKIGRINSKKLLKLNKCMDYIKSLDHSAYVIDRFQCVFNQEQDILRASDLLNALSGIYSTEEEIKIIKKEGDRRRR